jgi:hypothetical protein
VHNGVLPSLQHVHVLIGKVLNKTKTNIFSTVGLWGLFRPFHLLRARKTDTRKEPSYMCCVRKVTLTHLGVEISITQKVRKFKFPQPLKPHFPAWIQTTGSFIIRLHPKSHPSRSWNSLGWPCALTQVWKLTDNPCNKSIIILLQGVKVSTLCLWVWKKGVSVINF